MPRTPQETFVSPLCDLTLQELVAVGVLTENSKSPLNITLSPPQGINEMLAMKGGAKKKPLKKVAGVKKAAPKAKKR